jgi:hypothetical protein
VEPIVISDAQRAQQKRCLKLIIVFKSVVKGAVVLAAAVVVSASGWAVTAS